MSAAPPRPDARAKLEGAVDFGYDVDVPGMWWGALVPSPVAHGRLRSVDLAPALALGDVVAVGASDVVRVLGIPAEAVERPLFPTDEVEFRFQPVAAVAAPTRERALEAARAVVVQVDPLPIVADLEDVFPEWPGPNADASPHIAVHVRAREGDVEAVFRTAETVVRETYRTASVHQVALEAHACVAEVEGDRYRVRTTTQTPFGAREDIASRLGIPEESLVVEGTWVGGGFGGKGSALLEPYALLLAKATGHPVRLAQGYREEFLRGRTTLPSVIRMETAVSQGRIVARRVRLLLDIGNSLPGRDWATGYSIGFLLGPYRTPVFEVEGYGVRTNKPPFGPHRAPFAPQCAFVLESHLDHVAREAGVDPVAFRAEHLWKEGDSTAFSQAVGPFGLASAFELARAKATEWKATAGPDTGVGVALGFWSTGTGAGGEARVRLTPQRLTVTQGEREIGSGSVLSGVAAVAARATGLPLDRVTVEYGDTHHAPFDSGVFGSRTTAALGRAVEEACSALLEELGTRLGPSKGARLAVRGDEIVVVAGKVERPLRELLTESERSPEGISRTGKHYGTAGTIDETKAEVGTFYPYTDFTGAAHVAEVTVDRATGTVRVTRYAAFHDVGVVIDPPSATAQVEGGVAMGLGTALTEEALWSSDGRLLNPGLLDYRIPTLGEIPPIEVTFVEGFAGAGPFGAKGLGEPPMIPVPAAVALAVRDATGAHVTELPLSSERVARALKLI